MHLAILTGETTTVGGVESLTNAMQILMNLAGTVIDICVNNPVLAIFIAGGLVGTVIGIIKAAKSI